MSYLDRLKGQNSEKQAPKALQKLQKDPFYSFCSSDIAHIQEIEAFPANDAKPEPAPVADPLIVEVWTPSGTAMTIRADNAEHAAWLKRMNPRPATPAPKPPVPEPEPDAERISEAEHNAQGRYFKFLATWPDGSQCYLCQMPRMTLAEMRAQYPTATKIEPTTQDYRNDAY